ncbi:MAG: hypothetical protein ACYTX0_06130 [Nostoc sp.]
MKNFTDLNAWAVEQWEDAELGDSRRTQRAIALCVQQLPLIPKPVCQISCQVGMKSEQPTDYLQKKK